MCVRVCVSVRVCQVQVLASIKLSLLGYLHESRVGNRCRFTLRSRPYSNGNQSQVARLSLLLTASFSPSSFSRLSFITSWSRMGVTRGCKSRGDRLVTIQKGDMQMN